ncbi:hypothetical protein BGX26_000163 [Mortierella sp. AD094]|nr:hypothetical protein BGX26_000163 [Mortierella sp. AD094]
MKRPADQVIISPNVRRSRLSVEQTNSPEAAISREEQIWAHRQEEVLALAATSSDLYVCFLSAVSLIRRHFLEKDDPSKKTALRFEAIFDLDAEKWECHLSHPSTTTTFKSGLFSRQSTATCWAAFVACKELQLDCPKIGSTATDLPTQVLACIGEKITKMVYSMEGFVNIPHSNEGNLTNRGERKLCNTHLHSCAKDLTVGTFFSGDLLSGRDVAKFVRTTVGRAYYRGEMSLALTVASGVIGPMVGIATWQDFTRLLNRIPPRRVPVTIFDGEVESIEGILGYGFANKAVLKEAMTHESSLVPTKDNKDNKDNKPKKAKKAKAKFSYERLEFLGDAALDFLAAMYWLERDRMMDEGVLRKKIRDGTTNSALGAVCIELGLYRSLRHVGLNHEILMGEQAVEGLERIPQYWDDKAIPKVCFANVIESAFGAVFIDSGFNLQATQRLFDKIACPFYMRNFPTD